jgi:hypothetical protein
VVFHFCMQWGRWFQSTSSNDVTTIIIVYNTKQQGSKPRRHHCHVVILNSLPQTQIHQRKPTMFHLTVLHPDLKVIIITELLSSNIRLKLAFTLNLNPDSSLMYSFLAL